MAYKEIIVYLDPTSDTADRLQVAIGMAAAHGARLIGVDACSDAAFEGEWRERAVGLVDLFETSIKEAGVRGAYRGADRAGKGSAVALFP